MKKVSIIGKLPPPYFGPAISTVTILGSDLKKDFDLVHFDSTLNRDMKGFGRTSIRKIFETISMYARFVCFIRKEKPVLVLAPFSQTTLGFLKDAPFLLITRMFRKKLLLQLHGSNLLNWLQSSSWCTRTFVIRTLSKAQGVIVLGDKLKYLFQGIFPEDRIFVVPNGGNYNIPARTRKDDVIRVIYLANWMKNKGIVELVNAAVQLHEKNMNLEFFFVGGRPEKDTEQYCLDTLNRAGVRYRAFDERESRNKMALLADSDIFVFPPTAPEGHPWVIVEAMAAGLPIISTDKGAISESVRDGENGYIVDADSPEQIAEKIELLVNDEKMRKEMGKRSRKIYERNFTEEKMVARLRKSFQTIIDEK